MRKVVDSDPGVSEMLGEFQKLQIELQTAQMTGKQPDQEIMSRVQSLSTMLATKPLAAQYLQAQAAFTVMMNDVFQIIGNAVGMQ